MAPGFMGSQESPGKSPPALALRGIRCWRDGKLSPAPGQDTWSRLCHPQQGHLTPKRKSEGAISCGVMGEWAGVLQIGLEGERQGTEAAGWMQAPAPPRAS